ncbi:uncharacterized protein LOC111088762, partial [Limulus polyphemus]|uniref:Uncharacterized protein LOC111088762 n=1 Tax=Limulus polyphemus TaxID=6850 RepID=A0ABM1THM9_LIMPO
QSISQSLTVSMSIFKQMYNLLEKAFKTLNTSVLVEATGTLSSLFRLILESLQLPVLQEATFCSPATPALKSAHENTNQGEDIRNLVLFLVEIMDECFIPLAMFHATTSGGGEVLSSVCSIITTLNQVDKFLVIPQVGDLFEKLLKCGFLNSLWSFRKLLPHSDVSVTPTVITSNIFLKHYLQWLAAKENVTNENFLKMLSMGVDFMGTTLDEILTLLSQRNHAVGEELENKTAYSQVTILFMLYCCCMHSESLVPAPTLLPHLVSFVNLNSDLMLLPVTSLKHLVLLLAIVTNHTREVEDHCFQSLENANTVVLQSLSHLTSLESIYTHNQSILVWSFTSEAHASVMGIYVIQQWLSVCEMSLKDDREACILVRLLNTNLIASETFLKLLVSDSLEMVTRIARFLKLPPENEDMQADIIKQWEQLMHTLIIHLPGILYKLLLYLTEDQHHEPTIGILLDLLVWGKYQSQTPVEELQMEGYKLVSQICRYLITRKTGDSKVVVNGLIYLQEELIQSCVTEDTRSVTLVSSNFQFLTLLNSCFYTDDEDVLTEALGLTATLATLQVQYNLKWSHSLKVTMKQVLNWIQMSNLKVQKSSIKLLTGFFVKHFQNGVVQLKSETSNEDSHRNHYLGLCPTDCRTILLLMQNILIQHYMANIGQNLLQEPTCLYAIHYFGSPCMYTYILIYFEATNDYIGVKLKSSNKCEQNNFNMAMLDFMLKNALLDDEALSCITSMFAYLHATDTFLEQHLLLQPWTKVVLNVRLNRENLQETDSRIIQLFLMFTRCPRYNPLLVDMVCEYGKLLAENAEIVRHSNLLQDLASTIHGGIYSKYVRPDLVYSLRTLTTDLAEKEKEEE